MENNQDFFYIREATNKDIESILQLSKEQLKYHNSFREDMYDFSENVFEIYRQFLNNTIGKDPYNRVFLVIEKKSKEVIGYMTAYLKFKKPFEKVKKMGEIGDAFIKKEFRNYGIGESLLDYCEDFLISLGADTVYVLVDELNYTGISAWEKFGFESYQKKMIKRLN